MKTKSVSHGRLTNPPPRACLATVAALSSILIWSGSAMWSRGAAFADCSGVTDPPASAVPAANMGPVEVLQAFLADGATPMPLDVADCIGTGGLKVFVPWSGAGANPPATISFFGACPDGAEQVIITAGGFAGPATWSAFDSVGALVDIAVVPAGGLVTFPLSGPRIQDVTVEGAELCILQVCWDCGSSTSTSPITFDDHPLGTIITNQYEAAGVLFDDVRSPVRIVGAVPPGTASGKQALEVRYVGDPPAHAGPMKFRFTAPQNRVRVHVGQHFGKNDPKTEAVLRAFRATGEMVARSYAWIGAGPGPIQTELEVDAGKSVISRVEVQFVRRDTAGNLEREIDVNGVEVIDDLSFSGASPVPPDDPPQVRITKPQNGQIFFGASPIALEGTVAEDRGLTKLVLRQELLDADPDPKPIALDWSGKPPELSFPASSGSLQVSLHPGRNRLSVEATDSGGHSHEAGVEVVLSPPPVLVIESPLKGAVISKSEVTVTGRIEKPYGALLKSQVTIAVDAEDPKLEDLPSREVQMLTKNISSYAFEATVPVGARLARSKSVITIAVLDEGGLQSLATVDVLVDLVSRVEAQDLEVTQSTLSPILVAGKGTVVRLYANPLDPTGGTLNDVGAHLRGYRDGLELPGSPLLPTGPDEIEISPADSFADRQNDQAKTWNFLLPGSWRNTAGDIYLYALIDPDNELGECGPCTANNAISRTVTLVEGEALTIQPLRVNYGDAGVRREPTDAEIWFGLEGIVRTYPYGQITILPFLDHWTDEDPIENTTSGNRRIVDEIYDEYTCYDSNGFFGWIADHLFAGCGWSTYYVGFTEIAPTMCPGGIAYLESPACVAEVNPWVAAQELAHCMDRSHAGNSHGEADGGGYDDEFPYAHGGIGAVGFDTSGMVAIPTNEPYPTGSPNLSDTCRLCDSASQTCHTHDFMSYGQDPDWISDYTWEALYAHGFSGWIGPGAFRTKGRKAGPMAGGGGKLLEAVHIVGTVEEDSSVTFRPFYIGQLAGDFPSDAGEGPFLAVARGAAGERLAARYFDAVRPADGPGGRISILLPFVPGTVEVVILKDGVLLERRGVSAHPPAVSLLFPNGGERFAADEEIEVRWDGSDLDSDPLRYGVQYSPDGGSTWRSLNVYIEETSLRVKLSSLPGGFQALFRVMATDGLLTAWDSSDAPFTVGGKPPFPVILAPRDAQRIDPDDHLVLEGTASDLEDGPLQGDALVWRSSIDGVLGKGRCVDVARLSPGSHTITLEAVDASGMQAATQIQIAVGEKPGQEKPRFLRGDANGDGQVQISDAISLLNYLFLGGAAPPCEKAADSNDDGKLDISDARYTLSFLFIGGAPPPEPFVEPGPDPTPDDLTCRNPRR